MLGKLLVHGSVISINTEPGGAATIQVLLDSSQTKRGSVVTLPAKTNITFFCPNFEPSKIRIGSSVWVNLELFADSENTSMMKTREAWIRPIGRSGSIEYRLAGELFSWSPTGRGGALYLDVGFPISLTLGSKPYLAKHQPSPREGALIQLSKGRLYGHLELWDPEYGPKPPF